MKLPPMSERARDEPTPTFCEACLTQAHLRGIGLIVVEWAMLESFMRETLRRIGAPFAPILMHPRPATASEFAGQFRAHLLAARRPEFDVRQIERLCEAIDRAAIERDTALQTIWAPSKPPQLVNGKPNPPAAIDVMVVHLDGRTEVREVTAAQLVATARATWDVSRELLRNVVERLPAPPTAADV